MINNGVTNSDKEIIAVVADRIRIERLKKRFSQEKLAEMVNISAKYLNMIENQKSNPSIVIVIRICQALNIDLNTIWSGI